MGTLSKVRDNSQKIIWAFLITFILSMAAGGLMGGFNLVGQFKEWIGFNTSEQHALSIDDERISHQVYANRYESTAGGAETVNLTSHIAALEALKQRHVINELYEDIFKSNKVSDIDVLSRISPNTLLSQDPEIRLNQVPLKGFSEEFKDFNNNGLWDEAEKFLDTKNNIYDEGENFTDANSNGKWDEGEEFVDGNGKLDEGEFIAVTHDKNKNGKWDAAERFTDKKNGKWDQGEDFVDIANKKYDEGEKFTDANSNDKWDEGEEFVDVANGKYDEGENFTDALNGKWDSNVEKWISECFKNGKIDLTVIEDPYFKQLIKNNLSPIRETYKLTKLNSVTNSLDYISNADIDFEENLTKTTVTTSYIRYDLTNIDDEAIKIDEDKINSSITPYSIDSDGISNSTLVIITLLLLIYSYINRESRAKLSFGGFFFIVLLLTTIFKFMDYSSQGADKVRTISYVYLSKKDTKKPTDGNDVWDEGEKFTDLNGNGVWDEGEKFDDITPNEDFNKTKNNIINGITKEGFDLKYLKDNNLNDKLFENRNIVKNFIVDCSIGDILRVPCENNINNIDQFNLLPDVINETFKVDLGDYFVVEDETDGEVQNIIIAHVQSQDNYYQFKEFEKLKKDFIKDEKQKNVKEEFKDLLAEISDSKDDPNSLYNLFSDFKNENSSFTRGEADGILNAIVVPSTDDPLVSSINGLSAVNNASIIGTLYELDNGDVSDIVFSTDGKYAYVFFMEEKSYIETDIDYQQKKKTKRNRNRQNIVTDSYFQSMKDELVIRDWRDEASMTVTVDPDSRSTKNLSNLYFDYNSYLQLRNTLLGR